MKKKSWETFSWLLQPPCLFWIPTASSITLTSLHPNSLDCTFSASTFYGVQDEKKKYQL